MRRCSYLALIYLCSLCTNFNIVFDQKNQPFVTPEMFGAKGDGKADDIPAFIKMFQYVESKTISLSANSLRRSAPIIELTGGKDY